MGYAARANQAARDRGAAPAPHPRTPSGPRLYHLRMRDEFGALYYATPRGIVRAVTKVRGKSARRADKAARRPHRQAA